MAQQKDPLERLIGSPPKVRLLRLFFASPDRVFTIGELVSHVRIERAALLGHLKTMVAAGIILQRINGKNENKKARN